MKRTITLISALGLAAVLLLLIATAAFPGSALAEGEPPKPVLLIHPERRELPYNGAVQSVTVTTGEIEVDSQVAPANLAVTFVATGSQFCGYGRIDVDLASVQVMDTDTNTDVTDQYDIETLWGSLYVKPAEQKPSLVIQVGDMTTPYTGSLRTVEADNYSGLLDGGALPVGMSVPIIVQGSGTAPGTYPIDEVTFGPRIGMQLEADGEWHILDEYYDITILPGTLTIEAHDKMTLNITPDEQILQFDGSMQQATVTTGSVLLYDEPLPENLTVSFSAQGSGRMPDQEYPIVVDEATVVVTDTLTGDNVTDDYLIAATPSKLKIVSGFSYAVLTPDEAVLTYNGQVQQATVTTGSIVINGEPMSDELRVVFTATGEAMASVPWAAVLSCEDFRIELIVDGTDITEFFQRYVNPGMLRIVPPAQKIPVVIDPEDKVLAFNGQPQTAGVRTGTALASGQPLSDDIVVRFLARGSGTAPGTYPIDEVPYAFVTIEEGSYWIDVTDCYDITVLPATLTIEGQPMLSIRPADQQVVFNGAMQQGLPTGGVVLLDGQPLPANLQVTYSVTGGGRLPGVHPITVDGESVQVIDLTTGDNVTQMYEIATEPSNLTIVQAGSSVVLTVNNVTLPYTGKLQTASATTATVLINGASMSAELRLDGFQTTASEVIGQVPLVPNATFKIVVAADGTDLTGYFASIVKNSGALTITPPTTKIPLVIKPTAMSKPYTGTASSIIGSGTITVGGAVVLPTTKGLKLSSLQITTNTARFVNPGTHTLVQSDWNVVKLQNWCYGTNAPVDVTAYYSITIQSTTLTINKISLSIKPADRSVKETGNMQYVEITGGTVLMNGAYPPSNRQVTFKAYGSGRLVGNYPIVVDTSTIRVIDTTTGANVTSHYQITTQNGTFQIYYNRIM